MSKIPIIVFRMNMLQIPLIPLFQRGTERDSTSPTSKENHNLLYGVRGGQSEAELFLQVLYDGQLYFPRSEKQDHNDHQRQDQRNE